MNDPVTYDKAKYHYGGDFPADLPDEQVFVHTGMYLGWIIDHDLYSQDFSTETADLITRFKSRQVMGSAVYEFWDGCLIDDMLNPEGNAFSQFYFDFDKGQSLKDYGRLFVEGLPSLYHVQETWENYDRLKAVLDKRYRDWKRKPGKKWWRR